MKRKIGVQFLSVAVALSGFYGCNKKADSPTSRSAHKQAPSAAAASEPDATGTEADSVNAEPRERAPDESHPPIYGLADGVTEIMLKNVGLKTPESVLHDPNADLYLVSNLDGSPLADDDNGFISQIRPDGNVVKLRWIDGKSKAVHLSAPKGTALVGASLHVADIAHVRSFDRVSGNQQRSLPVPGASFLNDVCAGERGEIYVSDTGLDSNFKPNGTDAIYRIDDDGEITTVARGPHLGQPNGVVWTAGLLQVVTFGSGQSYGLTPARAKLNVTKLPSGQLDGVIQTRDGALIVSSWAGRALLRASGPSGPFELMRRDLQAPADLGYDSKRDVVLVPLFQTNELLIMRANPLP